jgi:hypothetical protein
MLIGFCCFLPIGGYKNRGLIMEIKRIVLFVNYIIIFTKPNQFGKTI